MKVDEALRGELLAGVVKAGERVLEIYAQDFDVETKADDSPLTQADMASHRALVALLGRLTPHIPILSEESEAIPFGTRRQWSSYWLIDPLDGTKEFIKKNGEFTLNVALIENGVPIFGVVHAPVLGTTWWGDADSGAFKITVDGEQAIRVRALPSADERPWMIVGSRSHGAESFEAFCASLPRHERVSMGSSLKLCLVAEGAADLYPRLAPTCEWDTAAAQAVVTAAGGEVLDARTLRPLRCNQQESTLNPFFIVCGQRDELWERALGSALGVPLEATADRRSAESEQEKVDREKGEQEKSDIVWHDMAVTKRRRAERNHQKPCIIWFTGLSGAGKSTSADALERQLFGMGYSTYLLDGDNVRHGLCGDLGFSDDHRQENIRRVGEVAKLMVDAGMITLVSFISPFQRDRDLVRAMVSSDEFIEVFVNTSLNVCEARDPKGLYQKARAGQIQDFTGISSPYEVPVNPEIAIDTGELSVEETVKKLVSELKRMDVIA